jgi:hypothetical protein
LKAVVSRDSVLILTAEHAYYGERAVESCRSFVARFTP